MDVSVCLFVSLCLFSPHSLAELHLKPENELRQQDSVINKLDLTLRKIKKPPSSRQSGQPLSVKLGFYLESLGNFRETQMTFDVDLYLYMSWTDFTLRHSGPDFIMVNDDAVRKQLWLPDLYFANARQANFHRVTVPNFNLFISPDGTVAYSCRVTLSVACNLDLVDYPMDHQNCHIKVLSYAYIAKTVNVTWFDTTPILFNPEIGLPEFTISAVTAEQCNGTYRYAVTEHSYKLDKFSCLTCNLYLTRALGFNIVQSYIPTGLIVIISWVSFWIDRRAVPARVTLSFTTLLSLTTIGNGMRFALPQVSYAKAIDYWFGACMLFVFLALLEYAVVNSYMRRSEKYEKLSNKFSAAKEDYYLTNSSNVSKAFERTHAQMIKATQNRRSSPMTLLEEMKRNLSFNNSQPTADSIKPHEDEKKGSTQSTYKNKYDAPIGLQKNRDETEPDTEISKMINEAFEDNNESLLSGSFYDNVSPRLLVKRPPIAYVPAQNVTKKVQSEAKSPSFKPKKVRKCKSISFEDSSNASEEEKIFSRSFRRRPSAEPNQELSIKYLEVIGISFDGKQKRSVF